MKLFQKRCPAIDYDPALWEPAVRTSICTGEAVVGFVERATGKFRELELARTAADIDAFCRKVGTDPQTLKHIY